MSDQLFPSWWGPKNGDPILCRSVTEVEDGWVQHTGHYDVHRGCWVSEYHPLDHDKDGKKGGSVSAVEDIKALRAAYKVKMGKRPGNNWDAAEIRRRMA